MIEDAKTDWKRNVTVIEELNKIPFDDPNMLNDTSKFFFKKF